MNHQDMEQYEISLTVNGDEYAAEAPPRRLLSDFLRHDLGFTGTHVGCEHGVCGMCTVLMNGDTVRSCLTLAVQADGAAVETVEHLGVDDLHPLQEAFTEAHGLQCGFCTPGMLMTSKALLEENPDPDRDEIEDAVANVLCRCTGYETIVDAVEIAADEMRSEPGRED
jgi:carbon-monoxide dehydrogenase small subunit